MILSVVSIKDVKSGIFSNAVVSKNPQVSIRDFISLFFEDNQYSAFPSDFQLFKIADYDDESGTVLPLPHVLLIDGSQAFAEASRIKKERDSNG